MDPLGHHDRDPKQAHEGLLYVESQRQANQHVLTQRRDGTNALRAENARKSQEIESLKAQLAAAEVRNC